MAVCETRRTDGFTLVELLVVVAVIAVLTAIVLPLQRRAVAASHAVGCASNLRNIYQATLEFVNDNNGKLPPPLGPATNVDAAFFYNAYWWGQAYLGKYVVGPWDRHPGSLGMFRQDEVERFNCPARSADGPDSGWAHANGNPGVSYAMAYLPYQQETFTLAMQENPARTLYLADGRWGVVYKSTASTGAAGSRNNSNRLRRYHNGAMNLLFYDGHVSSFSGEDDELQSYFLNN